MTTVDVSTVREVDSVTSATSVKAAATAAGAGDQSSTSRSAARPAIRAFARRWPTALGVAATGSAMLLLALVPEVLAFVTSAWCVVLAAVIYQVRGVHRGVVRGRLAYAQTAAVLGFAALALGAVALHGDVAAYVLAAGWLANAAWDAVHHRLNAVVPRWYAETCLVSDLLIAAGLLTATI